MSRPPSPRRALLRAALPLGVLLVPLAFALGAGCSSPTFRSYYYPYDSGSGVDSGQGCLPPDAATPSCPINAAIEEDPACSTGFGYNPPSCPYEQCCAVSVTGIFGSPLCQVVATSCDPDENDADGGFLSCGADGGEDAGDGDAALGDSGEPFDTGPEAGDASEGPDAADAGRVADAGDAGRVADAGDAGRVTDGGDAGQPVDGGTDAGDAGKVTDGGDAGPADAEPTGIVACRVAPLASGVGVGPICAPAGTGQDGASCTSAASCAPGLECVGPTGAGVCHPYCCDNTCITPPGGPDPGLGPAFCDIEPLYAFPATAVPVCVSKPSCSVFQPCPTAGLTCTIVDYMGPTACVEPGPQGIGESCEQAHCRADLTCWGTFPTRTCAQLCNFTTNLCATGQACMTNGANFPDSYVGICQ